MTNEMGRRKGEREERREKGWREREGGGGKSVCERVRVRGREGG